MGQLVYVKAWRHSVTLPFGYAPVEQGKVRKGDRILCSHIHGYEWRDAGEMRIGMQVGNWPMVVRKESKDA